MKKLLSRIFSRITLTAVFILVQLGMLYAAMVLLGQHISYFYLIYRFFAALLVLHIISLNDNPAYKIAWILPILIFPLFGTLLYVVFGKSHLSPREKARMHRIAEQYRAAMALSADRAPALEARQPGGARMSRYVTQVSQAPLFCHTETRYLPVGEVYYAQLLEEIEKAERFLFLEYYIIRPGAMWDAIHDVLRRKAAAGVDVRLIYDDFGTLFKLEAGTDKLLESEGIRTRVFNRLRPELSVRFNNRDHRKICVIDGNVGFTGGINISDEYINAAPRCGHWLDSGILLRGEGVWGLTAMFLSMWDFVSGENSELARFRPGETFLAGIEDDGFVQPFTDTPLDDEAVGETVYRNLIQRADRYIYINSPYLIIDNEMLTAMTTAAKCGVDIRLVTPAICDSRLVQELTRSYYEPLIRAGVKLYEYTPGMIHAKTFVCDDLYGVVGTINLDYRSLYLHYECAVWLCETRSVAEMKAAYLSELEHCEPITLELCRAHSRARHLLRAILRVLAPLF